MTDQSIQFLGSGGPNQPMADWSLRFHSNPHSRRRVRPPPRTRNWRLGDDALDKARRLGLLLKHLMLHLVPGADQLIAAARARAKRPAGTRAKRRVKR